jgi:hypothetical protein
VYPALSRWALFIWMALVIVLQVLNALHAPLYAAHTFLPTSDWCEGLVFFNNVGPLPGTLPLVDSHQMYAFFCAFTNLVQLIIPLYSSSLPSSF